MIRLFEQDQKAENRKSSKGNQLKWEKDGVWYKADYTGYEGLSEYLVSHLLEQSNLSAEQYVQYDTEVICYLEQRYRGCKSANFLPENWELFTLERLFTNLYGESLYRSIFKIQGVKERIQFLVDQTIRMTGLQTFGTYLSTLLTIDALFLNEDRHTHNIAVLRDPMGKYHECPIFDNGAALLSDTTMDYPMGQDLYGLIERVQAKTVAADFREQLEAAEELFEPGLKFDFDYRSVHSLLEAEPNYPKEQKERIEQIIMEQRRKYAYLFS